MMLRCNMTAVTDFHFSYKILIFNYFYGADRPGEAFAGAKYGAGRARHARIATAKRRPPRRPSLSVLKGQDLRALLGELRREF
jgi:hypothetical protein